MKAILNNCTEGKVGTKVTTLNKFLGYALGHVNIFELRDVCAMIINFVDDSKITGSWTDEKIRYASEVPEDYEDISRKLQYYL